VVRDEVLGVDLADEEEEERAADEQADRASSEITLRPPLDEARLR
jgi:hypothetical protein